MKAPCVYVSNSNILPSAVGILSPCLIFPEQILRKNGHELTSIVAHELAHLKRRDCLVNWFQLTLTTAMWWNPIVARVNHLLRCEMEHCCDDFVLRATGISPYRLFHCFTGRGERTCPEPDSWVDTRIRSTQTYH